MRGKIMEQLENTQVVEKTFTQMDVDRIVGERVARYSDYAILKEKAAQVDVLRGQLEDITAKHRVSREALEKVLTQAVESIPEDKRGLIPDNYDVMSKLDYINRNSGVLLDRPTTEQPQPQVETTSTAPTAVPPETQMQAQTTQVAATMPAATPQTQEPVPPINQPGPPVLDVQIGNTLYGGFASPQMWAQRDPRGYRKANNVR